MLSSYVNYADFPITESIEVATFADYTALLSSDADEKKAGNSLQTVMNEAGGWSTSGV